MNNSMITYPVQLLGDLYKLHANNIIDIERGHQYSLEL